MEYKILKFEIKSKISSKYFSFVKKPKSLDSINRLDDGYYHDEFGLYTGDSKNALTHAVGAIDDLISNPSDVNAEGTLVSDTRNYLDCVFSDKERLFMISLDRWLD